MPKEEHFHKATLELVLFYHRKFDVQFPPLNWPVLLYRYIKRLTLPSMNRIPGRMLYYVELIDFIVDVYQAVQQLDKIVGFTFSFPTAIAGKRRPLHLPEVQMMALVVISTKLLFPLDDVKRYPASAREPATQAVDWQAWGRVQRHFDQRETSSGRIGKGTEVLINEKDVFSMTPSQLDEYMDWYENSWLDSSKGEFPIRGNSNELADLSFFSP